MNEILKNLHCPPDDNYSGEIGNREVEQSLPGSQGSQASRPSTSPSTETEQAMENRESKARITLYFPIEDAWALRRIACDMKKQRGRFLVDYIQENILKPYRNEKKI